MTTQTMERLSHAVAAEFRATLGRQGLPASALADRLGKNGRWISSRISPTASVDMTVDEIAEMADALGVDAEGVLVAALRACRDSNPKPSDLVLDRLAPIHHPSCPLRFSRLGWCTCGVNGSLTAQSRNRSDWTLVS